jgi:FixJ family two-component response regulator
MERSSNLLCPPKINGVHMTETPPIVFVVDDDPSVRRAIKRLIESEGLQVELFGSATEFLQRRRPDAPSCLVLDIKLPGISGLDFQPQLAEAGIRIPIIFITGHGDIPMTVRAMKAGAVEFLTKPFRDEDLLDAIRLALERDRTRRQQESEIAVLWERFESLTPREQEILPLVVRGRLNKQIAAELGTSEITIKVHRASVMRKMQAESLADLVGMAGRLGLPVGQLSSNRTSPSAQTG